MAEQVVLEFIGDPTGLKPVADALQAIGNLTEEQVKAFAKANADFANKIKQSTQPVTKTVDDLSNKLKQIPEAISGGAINQATKNMGNLGNEIVQTAEKSKRLSTQLREMRNTLATLDEGSVEFQKLAEEAAKLEDKIGDTNQRIRNLASDTKNLDALISAAQGIAGGFAVAQGAVALFGEENEDLQKALLKVQGSIAILNGLQQVQATLMEESAIKSVLAAKAHAFYSFVVGSSTGALKLFRIALAATGIGLAVIALGALVANFESIKKKVVELVPGLGNIGKLFDNLKKGFFGFVSGTVEGLKVVGKLLADFFSGDLAGLAVTASQAGNRISKAFNDGYIEEEKNQQQARQRAITEGLIEENKRKLNLLEAAGKDTFALREKILKEELSLLDKGSKDFLEKENEINVLRLQNAKKAADERLELAKEEARQLQILQTKGLDGLTDDERKAKKERLDTLQETSDEIARILNKDAADPKIKFKVGVDEKFATSQVDSIIEKLKEAAKDENIELAIDFLKDNAEQTFNNIMDTISQRKADDREAELEAGLSQLAAQRDAELQNTELTENQREAINKKYARKEAQLKEQAWKADQQAKLQEAIINGFVSVTKTIATFGPPIPPNFLGIAALGLTALTTGLQIAAIKSAKPPKFRRGTKSAPGGWAVVGEEGEETVWLPKGAKVISHPESLKLRAGVNVSAIARKYDIPSMHIDPEVGRIVEARERFVGFDYEKLGKEIARHPRTVVNVNEKGLGVFIQSDSQERQLVNKRYVG